MWKRGRIDVEPISEDCSEWVSAGLKALLRNLGKDAESRTAMALPRNLDEWVDILECHLIDGELQECLGVLFAYAKQASADAVLPQLVVATIRRLEARWAEDNVVVADVLCGFATARHLIDLWQSQRLKLRGDGSHVSAQLPVLVSVVPGDQHTFGAQILSDDLLMRGLAVDVFLAPELPTLFEQISTRRYGAVLLTIGQDASLAGAGDLIAELRSMSLNSGILILAGGSGLAQPFEQYHFLGADLIASTAAEGADFLASRMAYGLPETRN